MSQANPTALEGQMSDNSLVRPWHISLARKLDRGADPEGRLGALAHIDNHARSRAAAEVRSGDPISLSRPVWIRGSGEATEWSGSDLTFETEMIGDVGLHLDELTVSCHGLRNTHIDGVNHISYQGHFYGGGPAGSDRNANDPSIMDWALSPIVTRGIFVDVPALRGTSWVEDDQPISGDEIEAAIQLGQTQFVPGDALLLYGGRDRFEAAGNEVLPAGKAAQRPGVGRSGGEWIADNKASVVCWDFLDALHPDETRMSVHMLNWAIGLPLVDNCDLTRVRDYVNASARNAGLLTIAPLATPGASGSLVNPVLIF